MNIALPNLRQMLLSLAGLASGMGCALLVLS